jgi:hypothetical protein
MMNRRKFFGLLPLSALGLIAPAKATPFREAVNADESPWVEVECQRPAHYEWIDISDRCPDRPFERISERGKLLTPACGQRFKVLRLAVTPICPKCGYAQDISRPGVREKFVGIPC